MIFGLAIVPMIALGGGAVDFSHRADVRIQLQNATDSAALAAARIMQTGEMARTEEVDELRASAEAAARSLFDATLANSGVAENAVPQVEFDGDDVVVRANVGVQTAFLTVLGIDQLEAKVDSVVNLPPPILVEIALVLDFSKSMEENDKYVRMTEAATDFIEKVSHDRGDRTKIGIVPFSEYVYARIRGSNIRGTDAAQASQFMDACLLNRDYPYSGTDETPFPAIDASRWPQADPASAACQGYDTGHLRVRDLTNDFDGLEDAIQQMRPTGLTNIALASEMGFHMLSPERPFDTARPFSDPNLKKVMVLLTDGRQTVSALGPTGEVSTTAADQVTAEVCDNAEAAGIRIFTIAYDITEQRVRDLLSGCASGSGYFEAESISDISGIFDQIYDQIAESVWLSQ